MKTSIWAASLFSILIAQGAIAPAMAATQHAQPQISIEISEGRLLSLPAPAASVFLADPTIADVQVPQPNRVFLFGKKPGRTTLYALGENGRQLASFEVEVHQQLKTMDRAVAGAGTGADVKVDGTDVGVQLKGSASDAETASELTKDVSSYTQKSDIVDASRLKVTGSQQVMLKVWVGEVDRSITKDLGFNWGAGAYPGTGVLGLATGRTAITGTGSSGGILGGIGGKTGGTLTDSSSDYGSIVAGINAGGSGFNVVIDALASEGLVTTLAEPNLVALSGESASFLAGGQFPIPVPQAGTGGASTITITYETYGVSLNFVPTVLSPNRISLHVKPEVSQLSNTGEVEIDGYTVPGLTIRRAETTVELGSGQSFAIAGLLENTTSSTVEKYPGLGDLPILGTLFRSTNFQHNESELVIVVTPYLVSPVDDPNKLKLPTDGLVPPNEVERVLRGHIVAPSTTPVTMGGPPSSISVITGPHLAGDAGFDLE